MERSPFSAGIEGDRFLLDVYPMAFSIMINPPLNSDHGVAKAKRFPLIVASLCLATWGIAGLSSPVRAEVSKGYPETIRSSEQRTVRVVFGVGIPTVFFLGFLGTGFGIASARAEQRRNEAAPRLTRHACLVGRRHYVSGMEGDFTDYYLTFEFSNGSREEFGVASQDYDRVAEGDRGILHSQGSWFQGFDHQSQSISHI